MSVPRGRARDFGPEISDLVVAYDPDTLERLPVKKADVVAALEAAGLPRRAVAVARAIDDRDGVLEDADVDGVLVRSHLELQRLHEEFGVGETMRALLVPMLARIRARTHERPLRVVDLGCGLGFVLRWLAAHGALGDDVTLVGVDYNRAFVAAASLLADEESLPCSFVAANAFRLPEAAHVVVSTGVLHHFRGDDLVRVFEEHEKSRAHGFVHVDIRPSWMAPLGSFVFHQARMREPLARFDGYWSAVRAHSEATFLAAIREGAPSFRRAMFDAHPGIYAPVRIFQAAIGARDATRAELADAYAAFGTRLEVDA